MNIPLLLSRTPRRVVLATVFTYVCMVCVTSSLHLKMTQMF